MERCKKEWVEQEQVVTIIKCVDCGVPSTQPWGGPTWRYMKKDDLQNNRCPGCKEQWEKEMWDVSKVLEGWRVAIAVGTNDGPLTSVSNS